MKRLKMMAMALAVVGILGAGSAVYVSASEALRSDEVKAEMLEQKREILAERVEEGRLTQEQADEIYEAILENQANCDGNGGRQIGRMYGAGFVRGSGMGRGAGEGNFRGGNGLGCGRNR